MISEQPILEAIVLVATAKDGSILEYDLSPDEGVFVGSSLQCGLQLNDDDLAGIHCRIAIEDGALHIQNWMSASGVLVNGELVTSITEMHPGDVISLGNNRIDVARPTRCATSSNRDSNVEIESRLDRLSERRPQASIEAELTGNESGCGIDEFEPETELPLESLSPFSAYSSSAEIDDHPVGSRQAQDDRAFEETTDVDLDVDTTSDLEDRLESPGLELDFLDFDDEQVYDAETVALLRAEIDELQAALAQRDADERSDDLFSQRDADPADNDEGDSALQLRMTELIEEANRSDERAAILEEMLYASEETNRWEKEERVEIESWVNDIERRLGEREDEHGAVVASLQQRLEESEDQAEKLRRRIRHAANNGNAPKQYEETLENLQATNKDLRKKLEASESRSLSLERQIEQISTDTDNSLREQRASLAQEQAKTSRLRFELADKLSALQQLPKAENQADKETSQKIRALREHLREIHEEELEKERDSPLTTRLAKLWKRVEY